MYAMYSFAVGIFIPAYWPALPGAAVAVMLLACGVLLLPTRVQVIGGLLLGMAYGIGWGHHSLSHHLPDPLTPSDYTVIGEVVGIPVADSGRTRFNLKLQQSPAHLKLKQLRLSWYQHSAVLEPGQVWQLPVRLRRPRGNVNPGGFDYQGWLLGQGISATGYVRSSGEQRLLGRTVSVDSWRFHLRTVLQASPASERAQALMAALTLGDRSLIERGLWQRLSQFGLVHLLVVSGLHIGFLAGFGFALGALLAKLIGLAGVPVNARYGGAVLALIFALAYSLMAGFSLPTQRALIMVTVALLALLGNRHLSRAAGFGLALAGVALIDPLAIRNAGFWLSFGAVAGLLWLVPAPVQSCKWLRFARVQWLVFTLLLLPLLLWQLPVAWLAPVINLVAIPWVGFLIIPLCLVAMAIFPFSAGAANACWSVAGWQLNQLLALLHWLELPDWLPAYPPWPLSGVSLGLMIVIAGLLILPQGIPGRFLCVPLSLALCWLPDTRPSPLRVTVLDVGQGLSVVVQTARHSLVYDAGPAYGDSFDTGSAVVVPFLRQRGVTELDKLVVSHADNDHAGGADGLLEWLPARELLVGETLAVPGIRQRRCLAGESWQWDGVSFRFLYPFAGTEAEGNNRSCVLLIRYGDDALLLAGDIEASVERQLLALNPPIPDAMAVLVAPHHGSRTSSSTAFVAALKPQHVVFSAGFRHHFGHPAGVVSARYRQQGARLWNTAEQGAVEFRWNRSGALSVSAARNAERRYWYDVADN